MSRQQLEAARAELEQAIRQWTSRPQNDVGRYQTVGGQAGKSSISNMTRQLPRRGPSAPGSHLLEPWCRREQDGFSQAQSKREQAEPVCAPPRPRPQQVFRDAFFAPPGAEAQASKKKAELEQATLDLGYSGWSLRQRHREQSHGRSRPECPGRSGN